MRVGVYLNGVGMSWDELRELWIEADALGFDSAWIMDNIVCYVPGDPATPVFEAYTVLSAMAEATSHLRLGVLVTPVGRRHPSLVAKMGAVIDHISGGRFDLGLGPGDEHRQFELWGMDFPRPGVRVAMVGEAIEVIRRLWTEPKSRWAGEHYHLGGDGTAEFHAIGPAQNYDIGYNLDEAVLEPKPLQQPHPPIWIGTYVPESKKVVGVAGRAADGVNVFQADDDTAVAVKNAVSEVATACDRDADRIMWSRNVGISFTDQVLDIRDHAGDMAERGGFSPTGLDMWFRIERHVAGPPEHCIAELEQVRALGFDNIVLHFGWDPTGCFRSASSQLETMRRVATEVLPHIR